MMRSRKYYATWNKYVSKIETVLCEQRTKDSKKFRKEWTGHQM